MRSPLPKKDDLDIDDVIDVLAFCADEVHEIELLLDQHLPVLPYLWRERLRHLESMCEEVAAKLAEQAFFASLEEKLNEEDLEADD